MKTTALLLLLFISPIFGSHFPKEIVIIGDSLTDAGNSRMALDPSLTPNFERTSPITSGTTWPIFLASKLGAKIPNPSTQGGTNFAYVGALTEGSYFFFPNPSLSDQLGFLPPTLSTDFPVFVFGGANDIFFDPSTIINPGDVAARNIIQILKKLNRKSYKTLIAFSLPDIGRIPSAGSQSADYTTESLNFNQELTSGLEKLSFPVLQVDIFALFEALLTDPARFDLTNVTSAPELGIGFGEFPSGTNTAGFAFFYDGTHPTQAVHEILAQKVFSLFTSANFYEVLSQKPTSILRQTTSSLKSQLYPIQPEHECNCVYLFATGGYSPLENPALTKCFDKRCQDGWNVDIGVTDRISDCFTLGLAGGYTFDHSKVEEIDNQMRFDLHAWTISAMGSLHGDCGYLNGIFTTAFLDYDSIKRQFYLGPEKIKPRGDTNGIDFSGNLFGAYHFIACDYNVRTGPIFDLNYQYVCIDGYKEKKAPLGNVQFKDLSRSYFVTGLGWEARLHQCFPCLSLVYDLYLMGNKQWLSDKDHILFRERSISGAYGSWPIKNAKNGFLSGGIHCSGSFTCGPITTLGYDFFVGDDHMSEHYLTLGITFPIW